MSKIDDLADWLGGNRLENQNTTGTSTITGVAVSDSKLGFVDVILGNDTLTYNDSGLVVNIPTTVQVKKDDCVIVLLTGTNAGKETRVIGVVGRGDEVASDVKDANNTARSAIDSAEEAKRKALEAELLATTFVEDAQLAQQKAETAEKAANEASEIASATNQHFFTDDNGVHVTTTPDSPKKGPNLLANSQGLLIRNDENILTAQTKSSFTVYDGKGNKDTNIVATFGETVVLGAKDEYQITIDNDSFDITDENNSIFFHIGNGTDVSGNDKNYLSFGPKVKYEGNYPGHYSVSFGIDNFTWGVCSLAHGTDNTSSGNYSFASGESCNANGNGSAAIGIGAQAQLEGGVAVGTYNATTNAMFVVGNGTSSSKKDAFVVDRDGSVKIGGGLQVTSGASAQSLTVSNRTTTSTLTVNTSGTCGGLFKDTPTSGEATRVGGCSTGSFVHYARSGNIVECTFYVAPTSNVAAYGQAKNLLRGLPKAIDDSTGHIGKMDGSTATIFAHVDGNGYFWLEARETAISSGTHCLGRFTYITND